MFKILTIALIVVGLCVSPALAAKGSGEAERGSVVPTSEPEPIAVSGRVYFADYLTMGGKKCAAFMEAEDGSIYCLLANKPADGLREEVGGRSGKIKLKGEMTMDAGGKYIRLEKYEIVDSPQPRMGPVREKKT